MVEMCSFDDYRLAIVRRFSVNRPILVATEPFCEKVGGKRSLENDGDVSDEDTAQIEDEEDAVDHHGNEFPVFSFLGENTKMHCYKTSYYTFPLSVFIHRHIIVYNICSIGQ